MLYRPLTLGECAHCVTRAIKRTGIGSLMGDDLIDPYPSSGGTVIGSDVDTSQFFNKGSFDVQAPPGSTYTSQGGVASVGQSGGSGSGFWDFLSSSGGKVAGGAVDSATDALKRAINPGAYLPKPVIVQSRFPSWLIPVGVGVLAIILLKGRRSAPSAA